MSEKVTESNKARIEALAKADEAMSKGSTAQVSFWYTEYKVIVKAD